MDLQQLKSEARKDFKKTYPHGVYHLHISNGKISNEPDENRYSGICVKMTKSMQDFIDSLIEKAYEEGKREKLKETDIRKLKSLRDICIEEDLLDLQAYDSISRSNKIQEAWLALDVIEIL